MTSRYSHLILLAGALSFLCVALAIRRPWSEPPETPRLAPLAIIPAGAAFVMDIDLKRLRKSATGAELSKLGFSRFFAAGTSTEFQPLRDVDEVVVAVPGTARAREGVQAFEPDALAVVAVGRFTGKAAAEGAVERIRARGGDPLRTTLGTFESVRDLRASGEIATRDGILVLSDGAYLRAVLAAAEGHRSEGTATEKIRDRVHVELRRSFGRSAPITATLTLPEGTLETALADPQARRSPLARVRSAALRVNVDKTVDLDALLVCATADDCTHVAKFLADVRADVEQVLGANALGKFKELGKQDKERIELSLSLTVKEVERFLAPPERAAPPKAPTSAPSP